MSGPRSPTGPHSTAVTASAHSRPVSVDPGGPSAPYAPTALGVLGGGQLGRMFVHAAQVHGFKVGVLDPDPNSPAGCAADLHLQASYTDATALAALARQCGAVTTEFENVPAASLRHLAHDGVAVSPPAAAVEICQHRAREKLLFATAGVPCAPHALLMTAHDAASPAHGDLLPGILKTATMGYDGKGQTSVASAVELPAAWAGLGAVPAVLERRLDLRLEISVIVARGRDGATVHLPVQQNLHRQGILAVTEVPAPDVPPTIAAAAVGHAQRLAAALQYVGVLCVEFFVLADGSLVANEMAPRPHNSGHHSIDSCDVSQFDLQVRTLVGLPLVAPRQHSPAVMLNLLGDLWFAARHGTGEVAESQKAPQPPDWPAVLAMPGVRLHLYGKAEPRLRRKMGHLTVTAPDAATARATAQRAAVLLGITPF